VFCISFAGAAYVLSAAGFYSCGLSLFKKWNGRSPRFGRGSRNNRSVTSASFFVHPPLVIARRLLQGVGPWPVLGDEIWDRAAPLVFASRALLVRASLVC
jgi:hypothetical protein